jgi:hypothetical protein
MWGTQRIHNCGMGDPDHPDGKARAIGVILGLSFICRSLCGTYSFVELIFPGFRMVRDGLFRSKFGPIN